MRNNPPKNSTPTGRNGFTFVELVVALGIGAAVIMASVLALGAIGRATPTRIQSNVNIGITNMNNFYNLAGTTIAVSEAPNAAATAMAASLRDRLLADVSAATAIACLPRNRPNLIRPTNLIVPTGLDVRTLISPDRFRTNLIDSNSLTYTNFNPTNSFNGASTATNLTIYILSSASNPTNIDVRAIYESDFVTVTNSPSGVYACVRRYVGETMTDYYHVFYPGQSNNAFSRPVAAYFTPSSTTNGDARFRVAERRPFYLVWWPDPASRTLASPYPSEATNSGNARGDYMLQSGATSFFFTLPAFPAL